MKLSEAFEGKNSSLRQAFESTTVEAQIKEIIEELFKNAEIRSKKFENKIMYALNDIYARGFNDGAYEQRVLMEEGQVKLIKKILDIIPEHQGVRLKLVEDIKALI